jgi:tRNA-binding EMAP/Myf-like protein
MSIDVSQYKVGVVLSLEECGKNKSGTLRACKVNVGDDVAPVTIVTAATNVREGSRLAVALEGSTVLDDSGEEIIIKKTSVGSVMSDGMFLSGKMLGWQGGSAGIAQLIPDEFEVGSAPPTQKPRPKESSSELPPPSDVQGLFEKKLTKEEKKKLAEERRKARAAKKGGKAEAADDEF